MRIPNIFGVMSSTEAAEEVVLSSSTTPTTSPALGAAAVPSTGNAPPIATSRNVYVASLPQTLNDAELMNLFSPFGIVLSAKIMREKKTRQSKGYGFVLFRDEEAAAASVRAMNTAVVGNSRLQVRLAHPSASKDLQKQCRSIPQCQSMATSHTNSASTCATSTHINTCASHAVHGHAGSPLTGPTHRAAQPPTQQLHHHFHGSAATYGAAAISAYGQSPFPGQVAQPANTQSPASFMMPVVMLVGDEAGSFGFARPNAMQNPSVFLPPSMQYCRGWC